jgi:hypothetical protein
MSKLSSYTNEIISLFVMLLLLAALVSGQVNARAYELASSDAAHADTARAIHVRLKDE